MAKYKITLNDVTVDIVDSYREACEIAEELDNDPRYYWKNVDVIAVDDNLEEGDYAL